jgi:regulator of protease activity HflC (stomatin/prohibitin superfamily)
MKRVIPLAVLGAAAALVGCTRVQPGYVGIRVNYAGTYRGVEDFPTRVGWVFYMPGFSTVFEYPTFVQTAVWTRNPHEGSPQNEEISFNSKEGLNFTADVSLAYALDTRGVPAFYVKFRSDDLRQFTHGFLRNIARDAFNEEAAGYTAEELYAEKKEIFLKAVRERVNVQMSPIGVRIEQFGFIGPPRPPESVAQAINAKIAAIQNAIRVENELRQARAEAQKAVATAQGAAQATVAKAEGDARANAILSASLTENLIRWRQLDLTERAIAKWDGRRPSVEGGGAGLLLNVTPK